MKTEKQLAQILTVAGLLHMSAIVAADTCVPIVDGPTICAKRFDINTGAPLTDPEHGVHFLVTPTNPGSPDIELRVGDVRFQLWSHVAGQTTNPGNIGTITVNQTTGYDYELKLRNPSGSAGAASVGSIVLTPPGSHLTRIVDQSYIFGALEDELTLENAALNSYADLVIGAVAGTITVPGPAAITVTSEVSSTGSIVVL